MHCGRELPENLQGPCPYCGKTGKKIKATVQESARRTMTSQLASLMEQQAGMPSTQTHGIQPMR